MYEAVSKSLRAALDDPATRYRIVEAWRLRKKAESARRHMKPLPSTQAARQSQ